MKELATMVARFTISMSSDDCGGLSEYPNTHADHSQFLSACSEYFSVELHRAP